MDKIRRIRAIDWKRAWLWDKIIIANAQGNLALVSGLVWGRDELERERRALMAALELVKED